MLIEANTCGETITINVGPGKQHIRWLGLAVALRYQKEFFPHAFRIPQRILNSEGTLIRPRAIICEELKDGEVVTVELRNGANVSEDLYDEDANWLEDAYGAASNLRDCKFYWKVSQGQYDVSIPAKVRGDYFVSPKWAAIYPQKEYGGRFEIPVEPVELRDGVVDWVATRKCPPGTCNYKFIMEDGTEMVCKANPQTLTSDQQQHHEEFLWEVPIADEPNPDVESRPSTASSRDGAQLDPRFEGDWDALRLKWVEAHMRSRVKDVVTEFYAILIDLFDSYAFMGLELQNSAHTMGMDDIHHLMLQSGIVCLQDDSKTSIPWDTVCSWYVEASGAKDARPYLAQRVQRHHYLELLLRMANWVMCERSRNQGGQVMPLDEGFFRFITDILMPVMDVYDDDPIRKDAVQHNNLIALQQSRSSLRSIYSHLSQPWPIFNDDPAVCPSTVKYLIEYATSVLSDEEKEGEEEDFAALSGIDKMDVEELKVLLAAFDSALVEVMKNHVEPLGLQGLLFWDFFELFMRLTRVSGSVQQYIPMLTHTMLVVIQIHETKELPFPPTTWEEANEEAEG
eukprot:GEMP01032290.1.p1 GENE.GEMP01032290.1~~GEMP01032290.1.p1  ORF type:complete len:568 (+),score=120.93 GEMP01032290.1:232-1935(+)